MVVSRGQAKCGSVVGPGTAPSLCRRTDDSHGGPQVNVNTGIHSHPSGPGPPREVMAGLLTARVLSDHVDQVTILERESLSHDATIRRGVPKGRHAHVLLAAGQRLLHGWFPGRPPTS
jgi:hypothetical protein